MKNDKRISVASRVHRILRAMSKFQYFEERSNPAPVELPLAEGEEPIGVYINHPPLLTQAIVVTDQSLIMATDEGWVALPYSSIRKTEMPTSKVGVFDLSVLLKDGSRVRLPILGGRDREPAVRLSDVFEFMRFLDRVLEDREKAGS